MKTFLHVLLNALVALPIKKGLQLLKEKSMEKGRKIWFSLTYSYKKIKPEKFSKLGIF